MQKKIKGKLCSLTGLVPNAAKDEVESSSCFLVTSLSLLLSPTPVFGTKGNCLVLKKWGTPIQLFGCKTTLDTPRLPASARLLQVATWFHWTKLVHFRIAFTQFAIMMGRLLLEFTYCKAVQLSVHLKTQSTLTAKALHFSFFKRSARTMACSSNFGNINTLIRATRTLPGRTPTLFQCLRKCKLTEPKKNLLH